MTKPLTLTRRVSLPSWMKKFLKKNRKRTWETPAERMRFVLELCRRNIGERTGGPFAAAIFTADTHQLISVGVNRVVDEHCSLAHGEIMAILMAQKALKTHDLAHNLPPMELVTSAQPCIQCYGAVIWSGIRRVTIGARKDDVERLTGFDEGPSPDDWAGEWKKRGIEIEGDILREEACRLLEEYRTTGGVVYNAGSNPLG